MKRTCTVSAAEAVSLVAERLADPAHTAAVASRDDNRDPVYDAVMWGPMTLANGLPGTALLYGELTRTDERWRTVAHRHLQAAAGAMATSPSHGLFSGPASLLAAAQTCAGLDGHYATLRSRLARWVADDQATRLRAFDARARTPGVGWGAYDLVNGISGTARLLLDSATDPAEVSPEVESALDASLRHLVRLTEPVHVDSDVLPGWWVPAELQVSDRDRRTYPRGDLNLGMAHGIAGPLSVLAASCTAGREVPGTRDAVRRIAEWLLGWTLHDDAGPYWPARVPREDETASRSKRPSALFTRTAWCYGTPGVAAALHRAGCALGERPWCRAAVTALETALRRDPSRWAIEGPTLCHGFAGLLRIVLRVADEAGNAELAARAEPVRRRVLELADESAPFGFRHLMRHPAAARSPDPHRALNVAGLLEGAAGVALALLPPNTSPLAWDRCLGLA
ncbi:lanthionine synthetase C family protein [Streptomyces sulphureus]|uniref:lanthionine synthetase C family protein n=1 Tax=Streptomyces sulphureus TaxID=47758 RepID=UPI00037E3169|nr:lanthionine synthetase C family protein [Streptomyces sulphureus]